jgi:hypothetical protein
MADHFVAGVAPLVEHLMEQGVIDNAGSPRTRPRHPTS